MKMTTGASIVLCVGISGACLAGVEVEDRVADLRSPVAAVRVQAATWLGRMADRSAVPALIGALENPRSDVRREAAKALGAIKDARAAGALIEALGDGDVNVRFYAAYALGEIKDRRAAGPLLDAIGDPQWCVRDQAAWALREIHDPSIVGPLVAALGQKGADVPHIEWLLRQIGGAPVTEALVGLLSAPNAETRALAVRVLGELGGAAEPLVAALKDPSPAVRRAAIEAILMVGDDRAEDVIEELAARENDPSVRTAAEKALFKLSREGELAAYWSFDDGSASVAKDVTGGGNDGRIVGCTPVVGNVGQALQLGRGKYVELGKTPGLPIGNKPLTIMAWVKSDAPNGVVVARGGAGCGFSLYIKDGVARFGIRRSSDTPAYIAAGRRQVVGSWVHLAGVVRDDRVELYVNGKLAATEKTSGYIPGNCGQGMEIGFDAGNSPAEITDCFEGVIDEVKQYQAALSEREISKQCR